MDYYTLIRIKKGQGEEIVLEVKIPIDTSKAKKGKEYQCAREFTDNLLITVILGS